MSPMATLHYSSFYICSALLCVSCLCYTLIQGRVARRQNQLYILLLLNMLFCALSNIVVAFFEGKFGTEAHLIADTARFMSIVFHASLTPMFGYYVLLVCGNAWQLSYRGLALYALPFIFTELIILMNPLTNWVYYYDGTFQYCRSWGVYAIYLAAFFYMLVGLGNLFRYWKAVTSAKRNALVFFIVLVAIGIFVQIAWQDIQIELFTDALAGLGLMLSIEDEDDRIDMATGAYNRRALSFDLKNFITTEQTFQVIGVRITDMASVHRVMGSSASDAFLRSVADYLRTLLPPYCIYYANPSTYIILIRGDDENQAAEIASEILDRFDEKWNGGKVDSLLHAAVTRGSSPKNFPTREDVLFMADSPIPVKEEKKVLAGRDLSYLLRRLEVERALHRGLEERTFEVYYQPVYEMPSLRMTSAEALLRLHDRVLGNVPPTEFIPAAEQAGIIEALGDFVLEEACTFIADGTPDELGLSSIGVNLSVLQCIQPGFAKRMKEIVARYGVDPAKINFEITESVAANDYNALDAVIRDLKEGGFTFAMDDYGTGYSNMQSIFSLDFDLVKIDKGILWSAEKNSIGRAILDNSVRMIREMHRKILVEGVETEDQLNLLSKLAVDYLQGFYFSKPVPKDEFVALARSQHENGHALMGQGAAS